MDTPQENDSEDVAFFLEASKMAIRYRLSFVQREANNHQLLERELANIWEAVYQSYQQQAWEELMAFREALQPFLDLRGYWVQSLTLNKWACEAAQALGKTHDAVRWTHDQADILHQRGEYAQAERLYQESEQAYRALGDDEFALKSRHMRSLVVRAQGRLAEAEQLCKTTTNSEHERRKPERQGDRSLAIAARSVSCTCRRAPSSW